MRLPLRLLLLCSITATALHAQAAPQRPAITGIESVRFTVSDASAASRFYRDQLGFHGYTDTLKVPVTHYMVDHNGRQFIETVPGDAVQTQAGPTRLLRVVLRTRSVVAMRDFLTARGMGAAMAPVYDHELAVRDPEGNMIVFTDRERPVPVPPFRDNRIAHRIIHAGFAVQSEAKEKSFYQEVLGFKPLWHGGAKDNGVDDWVSLQVPDGTDWLEFMLNVKPDASAGTRGVMNHVSLGVEHMPDAIAQLKANGCTTDECTASKLGRDGKVQLNLYDPDHTRVEVMEFSPTAEPCCSPFTGPMPKASDPQ